MLYKCFFDNTKESIVALDFDYKYLLFNKAYQEHFECTYNTKISIGASILHVLKDFPDEQAHVKKIWRRAFEGVAFTIAEKLGYEGHHYELRFHPMKNEEGELIGASLTSLEIKEKEFSDSEIMQSIINNSQDLIVALDFEYHFITFNEAYSTEFQNLFGVKIQVGMNLKETLAHLIEERKHAVAVWERALEGESYSTIEKFGGSISEPHYYDIRFCPIYNNIGVLIGASHIATNITTKVKMEMTIKELNEGLCRKLEQANKSIIDSNQRINKLNDKLELILEAADIAVWSWRSKTNLLSLDKKHFTLYRLAQSENITLEDLLTRVHQEDKEKVRREFERCISTKNYTMCLEFRIVADKIHWIIGKGKVYLDDMGEADELIFLSWDITDRVQLQNERLEALRIQQEKKEYFEKLAESIDLFVWIVDQQGNIEYLNKKCSECTSTPIGEIWDWSTLLYPDDVSNYCNQWSNALKTGEKCIFECRLKCNTATNYRWYLGRVSPLHNSEGKVVKWFGTGTDIHELKIIQERIQAITSRLNMILKTANVGLWTWDLKTNKVEIDDKTIELFNIDKSSFNFTADELINCIQSEDILEVKSCLEKCIKGDAPYDTEFRINTKDQSIRFIGARGEVQLDMQRNPISIMGIHWDVTKKKLLEQCHIETLKKEHENRGLLELLVENISLGVWTTDEQGNVDYINKYWSNHTGFTTKNCHDQTWSRVIHPDYQLESLRRWKLAFELGTKYEMEYMVKIDGCYRWHITRASPLYSYDKKIIRWLGTSIDVHELKETIKELEFQINLTKTITDNTTSGLFMMDEKGFPTFMNPAAERITGYNLNEIKSRPLHYAIHYKYPNGINYPMEECPIDNSSAELKAMQNQQEVFVDKNGRLFPVIWSVSPLSRNGKTIGAVIEFRDVTLEKQAERERIKALEQAELLQKKRAEEAENNKKRQEEFINTICHEVRNPLNGLIGVTTLLRDELNDIRQVINYSSINPSTINKLTSFFIKTTDYIKTLEICSEQQKVIVDDVLDLSKLQNNEITLNYISFKVKSLIDNISQMFLGKLKEKNLNYKVNMPNTEICIKGDLHRLSQILINLLSNAIKFTDIGEIIIDILVIGESTNQLLLCVRDTGVGMTLTEVSSLFKNFYQAENKNSYSGTGLGLVITKKLVELMKGEISVTSEKWKGSKFTVVIPCEISDKPEVVDKSKEVEEKGVNSNSHSKLILVVEDNIINQKVLSNYLEKRGYNYHFAYNGLDALDKCDIYNFNLILMDIEMPLMNGLEATVKIRSNVTNFNNKTPIVGLSGNSTKQQIEEAIAAGMDDYLTKPYHKEDVYKIIEKYAQSCANSK